MRHVPGPRLPRVWLSPEISACGCVHGPGQGKRLCVVVHTTALSRRLDLGSLSNDKAPGVTQTREQKRPSEQSLCSLNRGPHPTRPERGAGSGRGLLLLSLPPSRPGHTGGLGKALAAKGLANTLTGLRGELHRCCTVHVVRRDCAWTAEGYRVRGRKKVTELGMEEGY